MQFYRPLILDYSERWKGDRESDKKLLIRLTSMLEKVPEAISILIDKPLDTIAFEEIKDIELKLTHMPALLSLLCRLFSREFQQ